METRYITVATKGNTDIIDITPHLISLIQQEKLDDGILFLSSLGSTAALTTTEYEPGLNADLKDTLERVLPYKKDYAHNATWADDNAHSHLRSSFIKTSLFVSVTKGSLDLGTWQQVVLIDFDTRARKRKIVVKLVQ